MKKTMVLFLGVLFLLSLSGCKGNVRSARTFTVESERYSQEEIEGAVNVIKHDFRENFRGCKLLEIYYAGDAYSEDYQDWADRNQADEVIVLLSSYYVGHDGGNGSLNTDYTYENWNWILVRTNGGEWVHVDHGY